jgi:hypothetical protein
MKKLLLGLMLFASATMSYAAPNDLTSLKNDREQVVKNYILDLQKADYKDIVQLFEKNGIVISTSKGKVNAKDFFYAFLPNIVSAVTEIHQLFLNANDSNRVAARFHFAFKLKDGEEGQGEYVDEFIFADNSNQLSAVYMFENLKF